MLSSSPPSFKITIKKHTQIGPRFLFLSVTAIAKAQTQSKKIPKAHAQHIGKKPNATSNGTIAGLDTNQLIIGVMAR